jgi:hypothetical protein
MSLFNLRNLFGSSPPAVPEDRLEGRAPRGLRLLPDFVPPQEREEISAWIAANVTWTGGSFDGHRLETYVEPSRPLPEWGRALGRRLREAGIFDADPDYLHLFSCQAGQGMARHVDQEFVGEVVAGLTLGSSHVFEFARAGKRDASARVLLLPGDLYAISGAARHRWEHGVPFAKEDQFGGRVYPRSEGWSALWGCVDRDAPEISRYTQSR